MFKKTVIPILVICLHLLSCSPIDQGDDIRWVSLGDIELSLQSQPLLNVGFDIDDTVLFSSPGYLYGGNKHSPGSNDFLSMKIFWEEMNNGLDKFSLPKDISRKLIAFHSKRGDSIFFITGRDPTGTETLTALLAEIFGLENPNKVIFTGSSATENPKIRPLREHDIQVFYGDSDADIEAAQTLRIRGIRIMRAGNSTNKPFPKIGSLGEEVLRDSQF